MYPRLLRELAGVIVSPLLIICEGPWRLEEAPEDQEKANVTPVLRKSKREIQQTIVWSASPRSLKGDAANNPENHFQTHEE